MKLNVILLLFVCGCGTKTPLMKCYQLNLRYVAAMHQLNTMADAGALDKPTILATEADRLKADEALTKATGGAAMYESQLGVAGVAVSRLESRAGIKPGN